jgi:16S rRNA (uracil1498-N3)-methyltransferase
VLNVDADIKIMLHSREENVSADIKNLKNQIGPDSKIKVLLIIGPEGGFSPGEINLAKDNNINICHLSFPILRTETAGIVASSILLF